MQALPGAQIDALRIQATLAQPDGMERESAAAFELDRQLARELIRRRAMRATLGRPALSGKHVAKIRIGFIGLGNVGGALPATC